MPRIRQSPPKRYDGQVAVVTGASSGIGRRLSVDLAKRGAVVVGVARRSDLLDQLAAVLTVETAESSTRTCDVAEEGAFEALLGDLEDRYGRIDVLVNDAGTEQLTPVAAGMTDAYRRIFEVNFFAMVAGTLAVLPGMVARRSGAVVNVSSDSARAPEPRHGAYAASKAACSVFTEAVAHEVAGQGVHVHVLYPAWVPTAMGMSGVADGGELPPRAVRRSEGQVSELVLERMGGPRIEINASVLPMLAPIGRTVAPRSYQRAMQSRRGS